MKSVSFLLNHLLDQHLAMFGQIHEWDPVLNNRQLHNPRTYHHPSHDKHVLEEGRALWIDSIALQILWQNWCITVDLYTFKATTKEQRGKTTFEQPIRNCSVWIQDSINNVDGSWKRDRTDHTLFTFRHQIHFSWSEYGDNLILVLI